MIKNLLLFLFSTLLFAQSHPSVHQEQSSQYANQDHPPADLIPVKTGLDLLLDEKSQHLQGKTIALVTNNSGIDSQGRPNFERLLEIDGLNLKVIFSPEHGLFGEAAAGEKVKYGDNLKDLPQVVSLYGRIRKPTAEMLQGVDLIIYDIQDIGARFYTYISTMGLVMEAAGELGITVWILDRPNPIRTDRAEGPLLDPENRSFVGYYNIPIRYGLTAGELAQMIVGEKWIEAIPELEIFPVSGWNGDIWFDETTLPWVKPSPNIPDLETAIIYPGMCLIEGTNVSEGRGTYQPFKKIGAPWIDGKILAVRMNDLQLPGVVFRPVVFTPRSIPGMSERPKHRDLDCGGIEIVVTDRDNFNSLDTGIHLLALLNQLYPESFEIRSRSLARLFGNDYLATMLSRGKPAAEIISLYNRQKELFLKSAEKYRLYPPINK